MIKIKLLFSVTEAISIFNNAGLNVKMEDMPVYFENPHGDDGHTEMIPMWTVKNPKNGKLEKLEEFFIKYLEIKKNELFLTPGKLEIYNLFES